MKNMLKKTITCKCGSKFKAVRRNGILVSKLCDKCRMSKPKKIKKKKELTDQQKCEKLRKKCVALAKEISKNRDDYKCQYCGVGKPQRQVHSHHFFHEGLHKAMSADVDNLITLCASHHQGGQWMRSHDGFNFHNSPRESTEWFIEHYPERYKILKERSLKYQKPDIIFWENKYKELKELKQCLV